MKLIEFTDAANEQVFVCVDQIDCIWENANGCCTIHMRNGRRIELCEDYKTTARRLRAMK